MEIIRETCAELTVPYTKTTKKKLNRISLKNQNPIKGYGEYVEKKIKKQKTFIDTADFPYIEKKMHLNVML